MTYKKVLLSSSLAIPLILTGIVAVQGTADADTTSDATANTQVATTDTTATTAEVGKTAEVGVAGKTADVATTATTTATTAETASTGNDADGSATTTPAKTVPAATAGTAATARTAVTDATASTTETEATTEQTANTQATASDDSTTQAASTKAGDTTTAPAGTSLPSIDVDYVGTTIKDAESIPFVANVVAGTTGLIAPTTNKWGDAVHGFQNKVIDAVGTIPVVGSLASGIMKVAQPLDIVDNVAGGVYGLFTGKSDKILVAPDDGTETITPVSSGVTYTNNEINKTVTTIDQTPLYDQVQQLQSRSLAAGKDWFTDIARVNTSTGDTFYRVSTDEYVNAKDVQVN